MAGEEEGRGTVCIRLFDVTEDEGGASETWWDLTALEDTNVEMGQHLDGLCDPFATNF